MKYLIYIILLARLFSVTYGTVPPEVDDRVLQWSAVVPYGVTALLAHDYRAGSYFYLLDEGDIIRLIYSDGSIEKWVVTDNVIVGEGQAAWERAFFTSFIPSNLVLMTCYYDATTGDGLLIVEAEKIK